MPASTLEIVTMSASVVLMVLGFSAYIAATWFYGKQEDQA